MFRIDGTKENDFTEYVLDNKSILKSRGRDTNTTMSMKLILLFTFPSDLFLWF